MTSEVEERPGLVMGSTGVNGLRKVEWFVFGNEQCSDFAESFKDISVPFTPVSQLLVKLGIPQIKQGSR